MEQPNVHSPEYRIRRKPFGTVRARPLFGRIVALAFALCLAVTEASTPPIPDAGLAQRSALVISNGAYQAAAISHAADNARLVADALRSARFDVTVEQDLTLPELEAALTRFIEHKTAIGGVSLVYFVGQAARLEDENYLLPVGMDVFREHDVKYAGIPVSRLIANLGSAPTALSVLILDVVTGLPLGEGGVELSAVGLAMPPHALLGVNTLVAIPAEPGEPIPLSDRYGRALASRLKESGSTIKGALKSVRVDVYEATGGVQSPRDYGMSDIVVSLVEEAPPVRTRSLAPPPDQPKRIAEPEHAVADATPLEAADPTETLFWKTVQESEDPELVKVYLTSYPQGFYADAAREYLVSLEEQRARASAEAELVFWASIKDSEEPEPFEAYKNEFPNGAFVRLATALIEKYRGPTSVTPEQLPAPTAGDRSPLAPSTTPYPTPPNVPRLATRSLAPPDDFAPASVPSIPQPQVQIWLAKGREALAANRLLTPADDAAVTWAHRVFELEPGNAEALALIHQVIDTYLRWADSQITRSKLSSARTNIGKAASLGQYANPVQLDRIGFLERSLASTQAPAPLRPENAPTTPEAPPAPRKEEGFWTNFNGFFNSE